jgi:dUTP pyrophosphatase
MSLNVIKLVPQAKLPERSTVGSAGYDLFSTDSYVILPGQRTCVSTGLSFQFPPGTYGRIAPRSGLAVKHGIDVFAGVVDPDYQGEVKVVLYNSDTRNSYVIRPGYRIAQLILENYTTANIVEIPSEATSLITERGTGGFGSTGI